MGPGVSILFLVETTSFCVNTDDSHNNEEQHGHNFEDPGISVPSSNYKRNLGGVLEYGDANGGYLILIKKIIK